MNPIKRGWKAVRFVNKKKGLFLGLVLVQILFLVLVSLVGTKYMIKITENIEGVMGPLSEANFDSSSIEAGDPLMKDMMKQMAAISKSYEDMMKNVLVMMGWILGLFLVLNGFIWSKINWFIKKGKWEKYWVRFGLVSLLFLVPFSLVSYLVLKSLINVGSSTETFELGVRIVGWAFLVLCYFLVVGFCLLEEKFFGSPRNKFLGVPAKPGLLKKIFLIGVKKIHWVLLGVVLVLGLGWLSGLLIYWAMESFWLMTLGIVLLGVVLVLGKVFLVGIVRELNK